MQSGVLTGQETATGPVALSLVHTQALLNRAKTIEKITQLRETLAGLYAAHIVPGQPVALFAVPEHWNLGDSFIWQGQKTLLDSLGLNLVHTCFHADCMASFDALAEVIGNGTIVIHGGGNYGDLYPTHNRLTTQLLARFRRNRVVQLPQSIYYRNTSLAVADVRMHFAHPNFYLMVRDQFSYDFLHDIFATSLSGIARLAPHKTYHKRIIRCPDSAIAIGPVLPNCKPIVDVVYLSRRDSEKVHNTSHVKALLAGANLTHTVLDWMADWRHVFPMPLYRAQPASIAEYPLFRLHAANNMLCRGRVVLSDRLHASVLALLMGRPFVGVDNEYQKMERVMRFMFADPSFGPPLTPHTLNHFIVSHTTEIVPKIRALLKASRELDAVVRA
jgi:exopolysaccharide biosynthesis predicted pyruvyltransferase EpsI